MTPEQRGEVSFYLPPGQNPAAPETVAALATAARVLSTTAAAPDVQQRQRIASHAMAVIRRLLNTERQAEALRSVLAEAVALADDLPDDGLTRGDLLGLLAARGLDLTQAIEAAEALREAEALAGVGGRFRLLSDLDDMGAH